MKHLNTIKCGDCVNFDVQYKGTVRGVPEKQKFGWCKAKSVYPNKEQVGQTFPEGVMRAVAGDPAVPVIVYPETIVGHCIKSQGK